MNKRFLFVVLFLVSFSLGSLYAEAGIVYVVPGGAGTEDGSSWGNAFGTVSAGLVAAASGDEIWVAAGTYKPTSGTDRTISFNLKEGVALYGGFAGTETAREDRDPSANETILSGDIGIAEDNSDNSYHVVKATGGLTSAAILDGFTITGGKANMDGTDNARGGGFYCSLSSPTVTECIFSDNNALLEGGGMFNKNNPSPTVTGCIFSGNGASNRGGGMQNLASSPTVTECIFSGNSADGGGGMYNENSSSPTVTGCTFSGNSAYAGGGMCNYFSSPTVTNCIIAFNGSGIYSWGNYDIRHSCVYNPDGDDYNGMTDPTGTDGNI